MRKEPWRFIEKVILCPRNSEEAGVPRMLVVTGMGGCGKTQLMLKFLQAHRTKSVISLALFHFLCSSKVLYNILHRRQQRTPAPRGYHQQCPIS